MIFSIIVLTDFSLAVERARAYAAALAEPLGAELHLVHILPPAAAGEGLARSGADSRYVPDTRRYLQQVADALPVPATADLLEADWAEAVAQAIRRYQPLLFVAGLASLQGWLDEQLRNLTLPLAHQTGYPLLLVPDGLSRSTSFFA